ncbi:protein Mis18-beta [Brachyistius frenatus]|uniref:protein Mis18-beta n=1 Tax=Brachyistius frenatus TaxID=100188 RepID=UPI0037E97A1D
MEFNESTLMNRTDDVKPAAARGQHVTLHCQECNTVLADSFVICGEVRSLDSIMCTGVTNDVVVNDKMETGHKGQMNNCIFSSLKCRSCRCAVGKLIHSAPSRLAAVRSIFLLHKANISCYILNSRSMVKASTFTFDLKPLSECIAEVRQQFEERLEMMSRLKSRLVDGSMSSELNE